MKIITLVRFLQCPFCHNTHLSLKSEKIYCRQCQSVFKIVEGVPILIKEEKFNLQEFKQKKWFEKHYAQFSRENYVLENWRESMLKRIFEISFRNKIKTYLDIGCGATGYTVIEAAKRNDWTSFGVDISLEAMLRAKNLAKKQGVENKTGFIVCSAENLPFKPNTFDYLSGVSVLEHIENDGVVIKNFWNILKKSGHAYICVPNTYWKMWPFLWPVYFYLDYKIGHKRHYSIESLTGKMGKNLFKLRHVKYNGHLIKLLQLVLEKFHLITEEQWWFIEKKDINGGESGIQLNAVYQKK